MICMITTLKHKYRSKAESYNSRTSHNTLSFTKALVNGNSYSQLKCVIFTPLLYRAIAFDQNVRCMNKTTVTTVFPFLVSLSQFLIKWTTVNSNLSRFRESNVLWSIYSLMILHVSAVRTARTWKLATKCRKVWNLSSDLFWKAYKAPHKNKNSNVWSVKSQ